LHLVAPEIPRYNLGYMKETDPERATSSPLVLAGQERCSIAGRYQIQVGVGLSSPGTSTIWRLNTAPTPLTLGQNRADGGRKPAAPPQLAGSCGAGGADGGRRGRVGGEKSNLTTVFGCRVRAV
jgi:hypothetical protein